MGLAAADAFWGLQALAAKPHTENSLVALASMAVWFFIHLPAAVLAAAALKLFGGFNGGLDGLAPVARWTLALMGSLQALLLARLLEAWLRRRRP